VHPPLFAATTPELSPDELDARIDEVTAERAEQSLGGPIALMAVGGGALLIGGYILFLGLLIDSSCHEGYETCDSDGLTLPGTVGVVAGGGMLLGGGLWLGDRVGKRRELGVELKRLQRQRERMPAASPEPRDEFSLVEPHGFRGVRMTLEF
jgi:hypothetical protein